MYADNLADFATIKTAYGNVKAAFCTFSQGSLSLYNKDFLQSFVICKPFSEYASLFPERKLTYNKTLYEILIILIGIVEIGRIIN